MPPADLIAKLRDHHANDTIPLPPPASLQDVARAEELLGFPLPPFLQSLYTELSNGGFGPCVLPLFDPTPPHGRRMDEVSGIVDLYLLRRGPNLESEADPFTRSPWPVGLLPFCLWSAGESCIDSTKPALPMLWADLNDRRPRFVREAAPTLTAWLEDWLNDRSAFYQVRRGGM